MKRSPMPPRKTPLPRSTQLSRTPLERTEVSATSVVNGSAGRNTASRGAGFSPAGRTRLRPVSEKRRAENRVRAALADRLWPDRRDGTVMCSNPECPNRAEDLHEIVRRSQLGSIVSEENCIPVCRPCNTALADGPAWGYRLGLIRHDQLCCQGRRICSRYDQDGEAA